MSHQPRVPGHASRSASRQFGIPSLVENVPESAVRATVERCRSVVGLTGWAKTVNPRDATVNPRDATVNPRVETVNPRAETVNPKASSCQLLRDFITSSVPANARWAIERFQSDDEGQSVADVIKKGCCMGVSDGSFKDQFGTACWILKPKEQAGGSILCPCVVPGGEGVRVHTTAS